MKCFWALLLCCVMLLGDISLGNAQSKKYTPMPPTENMALKGTPVVPWKKFCHQLVNHQPVSNVNIQPGAQCDVHGRPVAPADVPGQQILNMPKEYRMFISRDQATTLNIAVPASPLRANVLVAEVVVGGRWFCQLQRSQNPRTEIV